MYRAALIGCGRMGGGLPSDVQTHGVQTHAAAYAACPDTTLVAVCDRDRRRATQCAQRWDGAAVFTDVARLMAEQRPEIVSICTPDSTHADVLETVLQANSVRAVLVEKPFTLDVPRAEALVARAEQQGTIVAVNYTRRYSPGHHQARKRIGNGGLGHVQNVSGLYTKGVVHNGTHWFDLARWLVGEIVEVRAFQLKQDESNDPSLDVRMTFEGGAVGYLQAVQVDAISVFEMDIVGTLGRLRLVDAGHRIEEFEISESPHYRGYDAYVRLTERDGGMADCLLRAVEDLVHCVVSRATPLCSGHDGLAALRVAKAAIQSAALESPVSLGGCKA